jgi:lipid II:glycine glycyltransferase (peptidoglycan interpeptide bridge formation enzyme)
MTASERFEKIVSEAEKVGEYTKKDTGCFNAFLTGYYEKTILGLLYELEFSENIIELRDKEIRILKDKNNG